jgi:hypothetical protein
LDSQPNTHHQRSPEDRQIIAPRGLFTPEAEYRGIVEKKKVDRAWTEHLQRYRWQAYMKASFAQAVNEFTARSVAIVFIEKLGDPVYAAMFWGPGSTGGRNHLHFLLGGLWKGPARGTGLDQMALAIKRLERTWEYGRGTAEVFDPELGACGYLPDHHEIEVVGHLQKLRARGKRGGIREHQQERGTEHG